MLPCLEKVHTVVSVNKRVLNKSSVTGVLASLPPSVKNHRGTFCSDEHWTTSALGFVGAECHCSNENLLWAAGKNSKIFFESGRSSETCLGNLWFFSLPGGPPVYSEVLLFVPRSSSLPRGPPIYSEVLLFTTRSSSLPKHPLIYP